MRKTYKYLWLMSALPVFICSLTFFWHGQLFAENPGQGKFYVIGTGPAGPEHATLKAIECMKAADVILCSEEMKGRFPTYLQGKPILCDPWKGMFGYKGKSWRDLSSEEKETFRKERVRIRDNIVQQIKNEVAKGKKVALLDSGDPCTFGPSHWFIEGFDEEEVEIIPGLGAFSAAMAALKKSSIPAYDTRFVMLTSPGFLLKSNSGEFLGILTKYPATMVFYMGLKSIDRLVARLKEFHPADLPIAVVYYAGYPEKEKVVKGTLDTILDKIKEAKEGWMGMIIVGRCLKGKPYRTRLRKIGK